TKQTYDLYVGPGFDKDSTENLWVTRIKLPGSYEFEKAGSIPDAKNNVSYNASTGLLSVTLDMSKVKVGNETFADLYAAAQKNQCQPKTFCKWEAEPLAGQDKCQCAESIFSPPSPDFQKNECTPTKGICGWAIADVDCPRGGCFGFGVK